MKSEKGVTLTSLVIYVIVATILISMIALISTSFFSNVDLIKDQNKYAVESNNFSMFFIEDIKNNTSAEVTNTTITLNNDDGEVVYTYNSSEKAIYRNATKIAKNIDNATFTLNEIQPETGYTTTKKTITVYLQIGTEFSKSIEYTLRYW